MKRKFKMLLVACAALILYSCNAWLDVKPFDQVSEKQIFSSTEGFRSALNGVYIELNSSNLYGRQLTMTTVEHLAKRFNVAESNKAASILTRYEYGDNYAKSTFDAIWKKAYSLISVINVLIDNCETEKGTVLSEVNYNVIKGEALALRAMLHFDLFRLFGPLYDKNGTKATLPYNTVVTINALNRTSPEFMGMVLSDLQEARDLLKKSDPIISKGPYFSEDMYDAFRNRTFRLNYYAVQTLLARAALYADEKAMAYEAASEVVSVQEKWYPFIQPAKIFGTVQSPDRIFSTEVLFALENTRRSEIHKAIFNPEASTEMLIAVIGADEGYGGYYCSPLGPSEWSKDYRAAPMFPDSRNVSKEQYFTPAKYKETIDKDSLMNRMIPLIRISEAFYIKAECAEGAAQYEPLNIIRGKRGLSTTINTGFDEYLTVEYYREFLCEGQLFFYYKRRQMTAFKTGDGTGDKLEMYLNNYVIPIPLSETEY